MGLRINFFSHLFCFALLCLFLSFLFFSFLLLLLFSFFLTSCFCPAFLQCGWSQCSVRISFDPTGAMKYLERIASYLPTTIVQHLYSLDKENPAKTCPSRQRWNILMWQRGRCRFLLSLYVLTRQTCVSFETAVLFADVSGFTKLSEAMASYGSEGPALVAKYVSLSWH